MSRYSIYRCLDCLRKKKRGLLKLKEKGLLQKKGAPETFDVYGLLNFIKRLQNEPEVIVPIFDRSLELSRSSAVIISKESKVIIVEGNYLLLNSQPWKDLQNFFDFFG